MAKIVKVCEIIYKLAKDKYLLLEDSSSPINSEQIDSSDAIANKLFIIIEELIISDSDIDSFDTLDIDSDGEFDDTESDRTSEEESEESSEKCGESSENSQVKSSQEWEDKPNEQSNYNLKQMKNIVQFYDNIKKNKISATKRRYSKVRSYDMIKRMRKIIDCNGSRSLKLNEIDSCVFKKFNDARENRLRVSELDIRRWGVTKGKEIGINFLASQKWIHQFKKNTE
jgi:hypothetical protein